MLTSDQSKHIFVQLLLDLDVLCERLGRFPISNEDEIMTKRNVAGINFGDAKEIIRIRRK